MTDIAAFLLALPPRVASKIDASGECWLWTGGLNRNGYGRTTHPDTQRTVAAHRLVYEVLIGPIPAGMQLDHLCRVRRCVNPHHVEPVTQRVNLLRGETIAARAAATEACPAGHPYAGRNLYIAPSGDRRCRECHKIAQATRRAADPEAYREQHRRHDQAYRDRKRSADHPDYDPAWAL